MQKFTTFSVFKNYGMNDYSTFGCSSCNVLISNQDDAMDKLAETQKQRKTEMRIIKCNAQNICAIVVNIMCLISIVYEL